MISLKNLSKSYSTPDGEFQAVASASLEIAKGDIFGIIGFSGAGKSTLLRMINLLEPPASGELIIDSENMISLTRKELLLKRKSIGMIFQHFNLLTNRTVYDNVSFPLELAGINKKLRKERILECLKTVDMLDKQSSFPAKLSGGQKQRVAIARAIATQPNVLLCDEPTSAVDPQTKEMILQYLQKINQELGITIVIVTHEMNVVKRICNKVAVMEHGRIVEQFNMGYSNFTPKSVISKILFSESIEKGEAVHV
jgi:D-methionine transport system ATP-binding protein